MARQAVEPIDTKSMGRDQLKIYKYLRKFEEILAYIKNI